MFVLLIVVTKKRFRFGNAKFCLDLAYWEKQTTDP